ncbi:hypothetical protein RB597_004524 [Gaeumannomyces tritici]
MAAGEVGLSEDDWIEGLLVNAEKRLAGRDSTQVAVVAPKQAGLAKASKALAPQLKQVTEAPKKEGEVDVRIPRPAAQKKKGKDQDDAGAEWFNMPRTNVTPELLRDLKLLRMRNVLNPKQFFKKDTRTNLVPTFSQVGTLIEGATEFHSNRLTRKERKRTLAEEVLASSDAVAKFKTKYNDIQTKKMSGRKGHYKKLMAQRYKKR